MFIHYLRYKHLLDCVLTAEACAKQRMTADTVHPNLLHSFMHEENCPQFIILHYNTQRGCP